jgi:hypothetical protein
MSGFDLRQAQAKAYVVAAEEAVVEAIRRLVSSRVSLSVGPPRDAASGQWVDFLFGGPPESRIAVVIVGPYSNPKLYLSRCAEWVVRAYGLSWLYDQVLLALPDLAALPEFERRIAAFRSEIATKRQTGKGTSKSVPLPKVGAFHIDAPKLTSEEEEMLKRLVNLD